MPARLIINADDFGLSPGINRAIGELAQAGAISSATLMAGGDSFGDAASVARAYPALGVGCHLVFVDGKPLAPRHEVASLLGRDGVSFRGSMLEFGRAALLGQIRSEEIELETVAQIRRLQAVGIAVTHVDTHKHTHAFAVVARGVLRGAARCGVTRYRFPFEPQWSRAVSRNVGAWGRRAQQWGMQQMTTAFVKATRDAGGSTTAGTLGILATGSLDLSLLKTLRARVESLGGDEVLELCVHPGHVDDELRRTGTRLLGSRETEYHALMEMAGGGGAALRHYGRLDGESRQTETATLP